MKLVLLDELTVSNEWQFITNPLVNSECLRITCTIVNRQDWDLWKFKSACYLRFYYPIQAIGRSRPQYIKCIEEPSIYEFPIPQAIKAQNGFVRNIEIIRASRYLPFTPNDMFAEWKIKIEEIF